MLVDVIVIYLLLWRTTVVHSYTIFLPICALAFHSFLFLLFLYFNFALSSDHVHESFHYYLYSFLLLLLSSIIIIIIIIFVSIPSVFFFLLLLILIIINIIYLLYYYFLLLIIPNNKWNDESTTTTSALYVYLNYKIKLNNVSFY
jgi:hypothetical protein